MYWRKNKSYTVLNHFLTWLYIIHTNEISSKALKIYLELSYYSPPTITHGIHTFMVHKHKRWTFLLLWDHDERLSSFVHGATYVNFVCICMFQSPFHFPNYVGDGFQSSRMQLCTTVSQEVFVKKNIKIRFSKYTY